MNLPDEVLVEVVLNLDFVSLCNLMLVCRRFYELVLGNRRLWSKFKLNIEFSCLYIPAQRRFEDVDIEEAYINKEFALKFISDVKECNIAFCDSSQDELAKFLQKMENLEKFGIWHHTFYKNTDEVQQHK